MGTDKTIAVVGATGAQGSGVVRALQRRGEFKVRALTRNPERAAGLADEVVAADLNRPETLSEAFEGAYGVFVNTNSFAAPDTDEIAQATAAIEAAKAVDVEHYVWSTLPDVETISGGRYHVPHFANKAAVNPVVAGAGFAHHTFVEPPFYYQNLISPMYPTHPGSDGTPTWSAPMRGDVRGIHVGDIGELGNVVAGAFEAPDLVGDGRYLALAGDLVSWNDLVATLSAQGHELAYVMTAEDPWGLRDMFGYFEDYTYFGPDADKKIAAAEDVSIATATGFADWARVNMPA